KSISLLAVGRKGRDFFRPRNVPIVGEYIGLTGRGSINYAEAVSLARDVTGRFIEDEELDKVFIIYSEFKSVLQQRVVVDQLLPVARVEEEAAGAGDPTRPVTFVEYIYEQPPAEIFSRLLPRLIETQIFRALLESVASEQGARMTAMDSATKNAGELISSLTLNMNRVRQAAITREIIEIVSGAAAL
ncbi:MAG: F0F1 ATP synthase subunit gamma, partial [Acidobacteria bacterium]|nr:F0F1 ATP synthase subunit gamma [Acidobacteriota bacterium]